MSTTWRFFQDPKSHLNGSGCMKCHREDTARRLKYTTSDFIKLATAKHDNKYNYTKVNYINSDTKVTITCPLHGDFRMRPSSHVSTGQGCPICGHMISGMRRSKEEFIQEANNLHNNRFDYSQTIYINGSTPIKIKCPEHGVFKQKPDYHLVNTIACPKCVGDLRKKNGLGCYSTTFFNSRHSIKK